MSCQGGNCTHTLTGASCHCDKTRTAKNKLTEFYNDIKDLTHVDWEVVCTQFWGNDEANMDRMRRKQAEFLVKDCVPVSCVAGIIVKTADREAYVKTILSRLSIEIPIYVDSKNNYFYP